VSDRLVFGGRPESENDVALLNFRTRGWDNIGPAAAQVLVAADGHIYTLAPGRSGVWEWNGGTQWVQVGGPAARLYGGTSVVHISGTARSVSPIYATNPDSGDIYRYDPGQGQWGYVGGPGADFVEATHGDVTKLYGLSPDHSGVWEWSGVPGEWIQIGGPASAIAGGQGLLIALDPDRARAYMYRWQPDQWVAMAAPAYAVGPQLGGTFAVGGQGNLYYLPPDRRSVWGSRNALIYDPEARTQEQVFAISPQRLGTLSPTLLTVNGGGTEHPGCPELYAMTGDGSIWNWVWPDPTITPVNLPHGVVGQPYPGGAVLQATGGFPPYQWRSDNLPPPGMRLDPVGQLTGTPTRAGAWSFEARVIDSGGGTSAAPLSVQIDNPVGRPGGPPPPPPSYFEFTLGGNWRFNPPVQAVAAWVEVTAPDPRPPHAERGLPPRYLTTPVGQGLSCAFTTADGAVGNWSYRFVAQFDDGSQEQSDLGNWNWQFGAVAVSAFLNIAFFDDTGEPQFQWSFGPVINQ
jgi:hypothetical protein